MSVYFLPALIALLLKIFVLAYVVRGGRVSTVFLTLIVVFAMHNAMEIGGVLLGTDNTIEGNSVYEVFLRLYYVATIFVVAYILLHSINIARLESQTLTNMVLGTSLALSSAVLFTDQLVAGMYSIGYSVSATPGPLYGVFLGFVLLCLLGALGVSTYGQVNAKSNIDSVRSTYSLLALAPVLLVCFLGLIFKVADVGVNATGLVPIATTLFIIILLTTESKHRLSDLRRWMPLSDERETANKIIDLLDDYTHNLNQENAYKNLQDEIERVVVLYSIKHSKNNMSEATRVMGLKNRSTLYSILNRLNINLDELKQGVKNT